jgi:hypothetical protein
MLWWWLMIARLLLVLVTLIGGAALGLASARPAAEPIVPPAAEVEREHAAAEPTATLAELAASASAVPEALDQVAAEAPEGAPMAEGAAPVAEGDLAAVPGDPSAAPADGHEPAGEASAPQQGDQEPSAALVALEEGCDPMRELPLLPPRGAPWAQEFWAAFRAPLPPAPVWNPPGSKRVGLQAGHWLTEQVPRELRGLGPGTSGGGKAEWEVNLDVAERAAALLRAAGVVVDILPTTVPPRYRAHVFLSIHADGDPTGTLRGYKLARAVWSATPEADDRLVATLYESYGRATGLPRDDEHVSRRMTGYYAFNSRRYCSAVAPGVPSAILEMGFLTNAVDRQVLLGAPDLAAQGIAEGLLRYLGLAP